MGYCDQMISQGIKQDCENPVVPGIENRGWIINKADIDSSATVYETGVDARSNVITSIGLVTGAKAYDVTVPGNQAFNGTVTSLVVGTNRNTFTNTVGIVILNNDPDVCENVIDGLATGQFVLILENKYKNTNKATKKGDSTYQIYGFYQGLTATTLENDKYSEDTEGGWNVVLEETKVPKSAMFIYDTDIAKTKAMIESLSA